MPDKTTRQLRVDVDADLFERLKILSVKERTTLRALVAEAIEVLLAERKHRGMD